MNLKYRQLIKIIILLMSLVSSTHFIILILITLTVTQSLSLSLTLTVTSHSLHIVPSPLHFVLKS